jgi:hypothetical protein
LVATHESTRLNSLPSKGVIGRSVEALLRNVRKNDYAADLAVDAIRLSWAVFLKSGVKSG